MDKMLKLHDRLDGIVADVNKAATPFLDLAGAPGSLPRVYAGVAAIGISFWLLELAFLLLLTPLLVKLLRQPATTKVDSQTQLRKAQGAAVLTVARLVGSVHNGVQVPLALLILLDPRFRNSRVYMHSNLSCAICYISAGYFLHDLVMCILRFALEGPLYTVHALACHFSYLFGVASGFLHYHGAAFLMWEISTPFVHTRWFMYKSGWANSPLYVVNGLLMIIAFFGCRIVWGYYMSYYLISDVIGEQYRPNSPFPVAATVGYCIVAVVTNGLNTYWFFKMFLAAMAVVVKGKKAEEVGSHKDE